MAAKFIVYSLLVATAYGSGGFSSFSYGVSDPNTGDVKDQHEKRVGGSVVGKYSLLESDGTKRVVEYAANDATGFNAVVHKEPAGGVLGHGVQAAQVGPIAPAVHPAPVASAALPLGGLTHPGALAHGANPLAHGALANPLAHGTLANSLAHGALANPLAHGALANPLAHGGLSSLARGNLGYPGYAPYSGAGYANPAGYSGAYGAPVVSSYSHNIVHNIPRPYAGPYAGGYGQYGYGAGAHGLVNSGLNLGHGLANPLANAWPSALANGANGWPSPAAAGAFGAHGLGARLGW